MTRVVKIILPLFFLFLSSCYFVFEHPLPFDKSLSTDPALIGGWIEDTKRMDNHRMIRISSREGGWMSVTEWDPQKVTNNIVVWQTNRYWAYTAAVKESKILMIHPAGKDWSFPDGENYTMALYNVDSGGSLTYRLISNSAIAECIRDGGLKGEITEEGDEYTEDECVVHATGPELQAFFSASGKSPSEYFESSVYFYHKAD